jgi:hypothetical protein
MLIRISYQDRAFFKLDCPPVTFGNRHRIECQREVGRGGGRRRLVLLSGAIWKGGLPERERNPGKLISSAQFICKGETT